MRRVIGIAAVLLAFGAPAVASPKIAVDIDGDDTGLVKKTVKRVLAEHENERPLIVYGTIEKAKKKGKRRIKVRLTFTLKDGTVVGELRVQAATREAAAARVARKMMGVIEVRPAKPQSPTPPGSGSGSGSGSESESGSGSESGSESESGSGSDVAMTVSPGPASANGWSWLSVSVGPELVARHFSYRDDVFQELRQYDLAGAAVLGATAEAFPLHQRRGWLAGLGGAARLWVARPFDSDAVNGETYRSSSHGYAIGARLRREVAGFELAAALDLGSQSFTVDATGSEYESMVPAVSYTYIRPGVSGRMRFLDRYAAELALGYRHVLSTGEISSEAYFPRASARGFDLEAAVSYALFRGLDLRAGAGLEQYGFDLAPEPGDDLVAGGATDRYPRLFLRVGYTR